MSVTEPFERSNVVNEVSAPATAGNATDALLLRIVKDCNAGSVCCTHATKELILFVLRISVVRLGRLHSPLLTLVI